MTDVKSEAYSLLQKLLEVFEKECCIPCSRCHELRDEIRALLERMDAPSGCVQPEPDRRTQTALCLADGTQRRSVWHPAEESPKVPDGEKYVRILFIVEHENGAVRIAESDRFYGFETWGLTWRENHMLKWAYLDELEAL